MLMSIITATGRGAQAGVLIKDAEVLERFASVDTLIVDKTGTLTEGRPKLTNVVPAEGFDAGQIMSLAASEDVHLQGRVGKNERGASRFGNGSSVLFIEESDGHVLQAECKMAVFFAPAQRATSRNVIFVLLRWRIHPWSARKTMGEYRSTRSCVDGPLRFAFSSAEACFA